MNCEAPFMMNKTLHREVFAPSALNDHEHCVICWQKISRYDGDDREGYTDDTAYYWVCAACWTEHRAQYQWKERKDP